MLPDIVVGTLKVLAGVCLALGVVTAALLLVEAFRPPQSAITFFPVAVPTNTAIVAAVLSLFLGALWWAVLMALAFMTEFLWGIYRRED